MAAPAEQCLTDYEYVFNPTLLKGKVAFVTGGATGIGFGITEVLMRYGCDVAIASRKLDRLQAAKKTLEQATGRKCFITQMDVRKPQAVVKCVQDIMSEYGKIDILVNNAAGNFLAPASALSFNGFKTVMEIDALGTFNVSKAVFESCMQANGGVIVNISATLPYKGTVLQSHASAAKAAIDTLTMCLANEWGQYGIRVVGVAPGPIDETEGMRKLAGLLASVHSSNEDIPIGRPGKTFEIANCVVFLASGAGSLVTGHTIVADGGQWLTTENTMSRAMKKFREAQSSIKSKL